MIDDAFAEVLRTLRRQRGLSQEALADETDLSRPYISQLERSLKSPSLRTLARLAEALDVSISDMLVRVEREMGKLPASVPSAQTAVDDGHEPSGRAGHTGRG
jgi:transcriptional regulator with XRE-family HTH domain